MEHREIQLAGGSLQRAARSQKSEVRGRKVKLRGQRSEVRVKLISDLQLLTSVMDVFYGLNGFNDLPFTVYRLRFLRFLRFQ